MNKKHISAFTAIMLILFVILLLHYNSSGNFSSSFDTVYAAKISTENNDTIDEDTSESTDENSEEDSTEYKVTTEHPDQPDIAPDIVADAAIVIDADTGNILYQKNAFEKEYPASITKIMTCLLALENCSMDETVTMSYDAIWGIERDSNHISLDVGEEISMQDCLYALMLESANEVAWGIGEHIAGGDITDFAEMMTEKAAELGCLNTNFTNANGLPDDNHYTTCYDMALITQAALQYEGFRTITGTLTYTIGPTNLCEEERPLWHHCKLIHIDHTYTYEYCEGGKTGFTTQAQNTLVSWSKKDGREIICVIMNCQGASNAYTDTIALSNYCFDNFTDITPPDAAKVCEEHKSEILDRLNEFFNTNYSEEITVGIDDDYKLSYNANWDTSEIEYVISYSDKVACETDNDAYIIGKLLFYHEGELMGQTDLIVTDYFSLTDTPEDIDVSSYLASPADASDNTDNTGKSGIQQKTIIIIIVIVILCIAAIFAAYVFHINKVRTQNKKRREIEIYRKR